MRYGTQMAAYYWLQQLKHLLQILEYRLCYVITCSPYPKSLICILLFLYTHTLRVSRGTTKIMASCSMASAASGFLATPNVISGTSTPRSGVLLFTSRKNSNSRLTVRAEEAAAPAAATASAAKPPPVGPKRGTKVCNSCMTF
ncbi:photosystem I reaction center subunit IV A, chloroplastic [Olea europaea subsp. europaea]|uniref:Photosystem I reaction center subunit IV A, chloroplastic n=1 Tax=Olea europaea subsp. europaea TaxID=158383 RepID=A0A8S0V6L4_OLEEU|nr:photosystem I reaction center subunit IV A, chloroplastic [Olea europaea subsp. europaea]